MLPSLTFVCPTPGSVEALLASTLRLVPRRENGRHLLHRGWIIRVRQLVVHEAQIQPVRGLGGIVRDGGEGSWLAMTLLRLCDSV